MCKPVKGTVEALYTSKYMPTASCPVQYFFQLVLPECAGYGTVYQSSMLSCTTVHTPNPVCWAVCALETTNVSSSRTIKVHRTKDYIDVSLKKRKTIHLIVIQQQHISLQQTQDIAHSHLPLKCLRHSENESGSKAGQFECGGILDVFMNLVVVAAERSQENAVNYKLQTNPYTIHSSTSTVIHIYLSRKKYVFPCITRKKLSKNIFNFDFSNIRVQIQFLTH